MGDVVDWYRKQQEEQRRRSENRVKKPKHTQRIFWHKDDPNGVIDPRTGRVKQVPLTKAELDAARQQQEAIKTINIYERPELVDAILNATQGKT